MLDILDGEELYKKTEELMKKKCWTIYQLAKEAGITPTTLYNWRDRNSSPTLSLLEAICSAFDISVIDFLLNEDELALLTTEQQEVIKLYNTLTTAQKKSILNLMKNMN